MPSVISWLRNNWSILLAIPMIALGTYVVMTPGSTMTSWKYTGNCVLIAFGLIMLIYPRKSILYNVGFYAVGMGTSRILTAMPYIFTDFDGRFNFGTFPLGMIYGIAIMAIGVSLLYTGYMFFSGISRAYRRMIYTSGLIFVATILMVALIVAADGLFMDVDFVQDVLLSSANVFTGFVYGVLAVVLNADVIRRNGYYERVALGLGDLGGIVNAPDTLAISRRDAESLSAGFGDCDGWQAVYDGGPADRKLVIPVGNGRMTQYLTAVRVPGMDGIRITLSESDSGTLIQADRFIADEMRILDERAVIYGPKGTMITFPLRGDADES